ncbi:hypothetical protein [Scytonema sp. PCC 10023]|uniref:hypothetical protein n=1 Tax=Scytonema sp. PCC 10023 TaxID=1680591 RepID=UPI0039C5D3FC
MPEGQAIQQHPRSDTSTGSLEIPDAPRNLCTRSKKLCTTKPNWFYAPMVSCIKQSFSMQRPTNCQGSVPFPEFALFTCIAVRLCQSGQWLADTTMIAYV